MSDGIIKLYRSPLRDGESVYTLGGIDQGYFSDGVHKDEKKPPLQSMFPVVMDDGRLCWEILDSEENRTLCQALLPTIENPPFFYSVEYAEEDVSGKMDVVKIRPADKRRR